MSLFGPETSVGSVAEFLRLNHYLGSAARGLAWSDEFGVMVLANPTSKQLPHDRWLEITRWCLVGIRNGGSQQFKAVRRWLRDERPDVTTIISYSDPSQGHTGSLYKACGFHWAPTWHRLRPPPSGNGSWDGVTDQSVKDRWIYPLRPDPARASLLAIRDDSLRRRFPNAEYREVA